MQEFKSKPDENSSFTNDQVEKTGQRLFEAPVFNFFFLLFVIAFFLVALDFATGTFGLLGNDFAEDLLGLGKNPVLALFLGLLATAIIQSSSTTTTMIITLVASGTIQIEEGILMVMGANIGTAITSTIVSLGYIGNKYEYERAVAAASMHDLFNIVTVLILFMLEAWTHFLSNSASYLASIIGSLDGNLIYSPFSFLHQFSDGVIGLFKPIPIVGILLGVSLLLFAIRLLTYALKRLVIGRIQVYLNDFLFLNPNVSLFTGTISTIAVQSSSVTTSLVVPLVAIRKVSPNQAFPFIIGANIGTTTTSIFAALLMEPGLIRLALAVAISHVLINLIGTILIFPVKRVRALIVSWAMVLGKLTLKNRLYGVMYVVIVFFLVPFLLILFTMN